MTAADSFSHSLSGAAAGILAAAAALAPHLAEAAGEVVRRHFRTRVEIIDKSDLSPVTIADRNAEAAMRRLIGETFPEHGIVGEEHGAERQDADWVWVLDPIDGTKSFISGVPLFGTLIALLHRGRPVLGVIDQPISRERWLGVDGEASTLNGEAIRCRPCAGPAAATLFTTSPDMFKGGDLAAFERVRASVKLTRYGADCYAYGLLAAGFIDAVVEADLKPYDYCAHVPIIRGAGGRITDWQGRPAGLQGDGRILASGDPVLHDALLAQLG